MSAQPTQRRRPSTKTGHVIRTEQLSPSLVRVVLGGDGLAELEVGPSTDSYVKLLFPVPGVTYAEPFDMAAIREELPREHWPVTRTYTIRSWDPQTRELAIDFVVHGEEGLAGPWARNAKPGDEIHFNGPGGGYAPDPAADWHLLVGDETALPAIAAAVEALRPGAVAKVFVEVAHAEDELALQAPATAEVVWVRRTGHVGDAVVDRVRGLEFPDGEVSAFVHGEATMVKALRAFLRVEKQIPRERLSISGYWRLGVNEDGWQSSKREWNAQVEAEQESA